MDADPKKITSGPKSRVCHVCGRLYMVHSFEIHIKQCKELWEKREGLKPANERKPLPKDPVEEYLRTGGRGGGGGGDRGDNRDGDNDGGKGSTGNSRPGSSAAGGVGLSLEEINRIASETFNTESLATCEHCGRTFLPEKLLIHNRSCTVDHPARRVGQVARATTPTSTTPPERERTERLDRGERATPSSRPDSRGGVTQESGSRAASREGASPGPRPSDALVGHLGGASGRPLRNSSSREGPSSSAKRGVSFTASTGGGNDGGDAALVLVSEQLANLEIVAVDLMNSISDLKRIVDFELARRPVAALQMQDDSTSSVT